MDLIKKWDELKSKLKPYFCDFHDAINASQYRQLEILLDIVRLNIDSDYGKLLQFEVIDTYQKFKEIVPITSYNEIESSILRQASSKDKILLSDTIINYEITSGSTSAAKRIPYTVKSYESYGRAIKAWLYDLVEKRPNITKGRMYFSLSISDQLDKLSEGELFCYTKPDDRHFFGEDVSRILGSLLISSSCLAELANTEDWLLESSLVLLSAQDLTLISIWSPSFLLAILEYIEANWIDLITRLGERDPLRALELGNCFVSYRRIWPMLDTISAWSDANSKYHATELKHKFKDTFFQPKGLLSTEAAVSIPLISLEHPVLCTSSAFFEFQSTDGEIFLANQLAIGGKYEVIITTYAGLYRYNLKDVVQVTSMSNGCPQFIFLGRSNLTSDLVGEKISEEFVLGVFSKIDYIRSPLLLYAQRDPKPHYEVVFSASALDFKDYTRLLKDVDFELQKNPHYSFALKYNQLSKLELRPVPSVYEFIEIKKNAYKAHLGNSKMPVLIFKNRNIVQ